MTPTAARGGQIDQGGRDAADRVAHPWGERTPYAAGEPWPTRVDMHLEPGVAEADVERWVPSASILHSNGDGQDIAVKDGRIVGVRGQARDRVTTGGSGRRTSTAGRRTRRPTG
jgi:hypothetical protein